MHVVTGYMLLGGIEWGEGRGREGNRERERGQKKESDRREKEGGERSSLGMT